MSLTTWLLREHPFFRDLREHLAAVIASHHVTAFDDLVIISRRPARTVLLMLNDMIEQGEARVLADGVIDAGKASGWALPTSAMRWAKSATWGEKERRYVETGLDRDPPALLWGQRWLTPDSAVERAHYILNWLPRSSGHAIFLGDDDMVSPLMAALAPGWTVHVADIDRSVLERVTQIAKLLGARLSTHHTDLSAVPLKLANQCDIVVSDPNPSADGSSESVFFNQAAMLLQPGGISITTSAPSHKPVSYSAGALAELVRSGFHLTDLRADFGRYELFDFDLLPTEREILGAHRLRCRVHHTKSLLSAIRGVEQSPPVRAAFDFGRWTRAAKNHYLTRQAGLSEQELIAERRGVTAAEALPDQVLAEVPTGLRLDIVDAGLDSVAQSLAEGARDEDVEIAATRILNSSGVDPQRDEVRELIRLSMGGDLADSGPLAPLGLAFRALDSWERMLLDAR